MTPSLTSDNCRIVSHSTTFMSIALPFSIVNSKIKKFFKNILQFHLSAKTP